MNNIVKINPVKLDNIPDLLKNLPHWVLWKSFKISDDGRFDKIPIHPIRGHKINWQDKTNQMDFNIAFKSTRNVSKHHPSNFQKKVLDSYNKTINNLRNV